jgi:hypothetical protein
MSEEVSDRELASIIETHALEMAGYCRYCGTPPCTTGRLARALARTRTDATTEAPAAVGARRTGRGCWYEVYVEQCVICGHEEEWRTRRWGPKPPPQDQYHFEEVACDVHFL